MVLPQIPIGTQNLLPLRSHVLQKYLNITAMIYLRVRYRCRFCHMGSAPQLWLLRGFTACPKVLIASIASVQPGSRQLGHTDTHLDKQQREFPAHMPHVQTQLSSGPKRSQLDKCG